MDQKLLDGLFKSPYDHKRWLDDQQTLINRMKKKRSKFMKEQRVILENFQQANQCSSIMVDIVKERIENDFRDKKPKKPKSTNHENDENLRRE